MISASECRAFEGWGEGVLARTATDGFGFGFGGATGALTVAALLTSLSGFSVVPPVFFSNMPIKDVVGGIDVVSRISDELAVSELRVRIDAAGRCLDCAAIGVGDRGWG